MVVWSALVPALFFIVSPLWVMRSRSMGAQVSGLILPAGLDVIVLVGGLITVRGFSWRQSLSIAEPAIVLFVIMFFVVILYAQASPRGERGSHQGFSRRIGT